MVGSALVALQVMAIAYEQVIPSEVYHLPHNKNFKIDYSKLSVIIEVIHLAMGSKCMYINLV